MQRSRLIGFIIAILIGATGGALLGWHYLPAAVSTTQLQDLRADYTADYVLMVAEAYAADGDFAQALDYLEKINPENPLRVVQQGLLTAQQMGYENWEMRYMADLELAVRGQAGQGETP